ncbi:hypothetical protein [Cellulomonas sp. ES6]|uniref:hypothetical protein n=1 Tax=Cellulomonas sp. ES6 TaxID=3039384 RepID=UPI0024B6608B|nr:hypothetical protein [Cellulomonas sp. ES6]WHP18819.1 hypothetical protein P9841_06800 [Cellulomonas sp. ES6]
MHPAHAAELLSLCASLDNRTVNESTALAWAQVLPDLRMEDATTAVVEHYREHREWIMPADIVRGARAAVALRIEDGLREIRAAGIPEPDGANPWMYNGDLRRALADGLSPAEAVEYAVRAHKNQITETGEPQ